ncbi:MAG: leucine-rich repeat protein, partial [Clostridia bacterium]|nr:leucine-rich repeat protein [Clostridia bacterium]
FGEGAEDYILTKVGSVENESGTVTIKAADEYEISDFFSYIKIDTEAARAEAKEQSTFSKSRAAIDINPQAWFTIAFSQGFESGNLSGNTSGQAEILVNFRFYYDFKLLGKDYYDISNRVEYKTTGELSLTISGGVDKEKAHPIIKAVVPITAGLNGNFGLKMKFSAKAEISVKGSLEISGAMGFRNVSGKATEDLSVSPSLVYKCDASVAGVITVTPVLSVDFVALELVDVSVGVEFPAKFTLKLYEHEETTEEFPEIKHSCDKCVDGTFKMQVALFAEAQMGFGKAKVTLARLEYLFPEGTAKSFYISFRGSSNGPIFDKFDWGECPNKKYKVNVTVIDEKDKPIKNAVISEVTKDISKPDGTPAPAPIENVSTDENGEAIAYFAVDKHAVTSKHEIYLVDNARMPEPDVEFEIVEIEEEENYEPLDLTIYMELDGDGKCGEEAVYSLYEDGTLYIKGKGAMWNFLPMFGVCPGYYDYRDAIYSVIVEDDITTIGSNAFDNCKNISYVELPDSIEVIGSYAFRGCKNLKDIYIPIYVTVIDFGAFEDCDSLLNVVIPDGIVAISGNLFNDCEKLESVIIPISVQEIGDKAFNNCNSLKSVTIPEGVLRIEDCLFAGCDKLTTVKIPTTITSIGSYAFERCSSLIELKLPKGILNIEQSAFANCASLAKISIPNGVESIGAFAFENCVAIADMVIPNSVINMEMYAFRNCDNLSAITIPSSIKRISDGMFYDCDKLSYVTISEGITEIGNNAFENCYNMKVINIPSSVTEIKHWAIRFDPFCKNFLDGYPGYVIYYAGTKEQWIKIYPGYHYPNVDLEEGLRLCGVVCLGSSETSVAGMPLQNKTMKVLSSSQLTNLSEKLITKTIKTVPGSNYVIAVVKNDTADDLLSRDNLLYIDQKEADSNTLSFSFVLNEYTTDYKVLFFSDEAHVHSYEKKETKPTCKEEGKIIYTCSCGASYSETL